MSLIIPPSEAPFWSPIARSFESENERTLVRLIEGPQSTDLRENLYTTSLLARDPTIDLVYMDVTWTSKLAMAGWLLPLEGLIPESILAGLLPAALDAGLYEGRLYRIPVRTDVGLLYYRADLLESAGIPPPEDLDELLAAARRLQSPPELWGFVWQGKQYEGLVCALLEILSGFGGFWIDPRTAAVGLDRPEAIAALQFLADCRTAGGITPPGVTTYQEEEARRIFQSGGAVFMRNWPYAWRLGQNEGSAVRGRIGVMSMPTATPGVRTGTLGGWGLGISAFSRNTDLAIRFLRHATTIESQRALCAESGYAPALRSAYGDSILLSRNPLLPRIEEAHQNAVARPAVARYALASDILQRHASAALAGERTPEAAMRAAARETRMLLPAKEGR